MKSIKAWSVVLALMLAFTLPFTVGAQAQDDTLVVASLTKMSGSFFSEMWGNNTADNDVRQLIHGYPTIIWTHEGRFFANPTTVRNLTRASAPGGGLTFTVDLQRDLVYNDGTPITAKDYLFNLLLEGSPVIVEIGGQVALNDFIEGMVPYAMGETEVVSGLRLLDEFTFSITVAAEFLPYYYEMALVQAIPNPIHVIAPGCDVKDDGEGAYISGPFTAEALNESILNPVTGYLLNPKVTSGPYSLVSYDQAAGVARFELNPLFKGNHEGKIPTIKYVEYRAVNNDNLVELLRSGEVDLVNKITSGTVIDQLPSLQGANFLPYPRRGFAYLAFAAERPLTTSQNMRQAIAHMIDRTGLVTDFLRGRGEAAYGYYGLGQWMPQRAGEELETLNVYKTDPGKVVELLEQDGWTLNELGEAYAGEGLRYRLKDDVLEPLKLTMAVTPGNVAANMVAQQVEEGLAAAGGELAIVTIDMPELLQRYYRQVERGYDMFFLASNFAYVFDPYYTYNTGEAYQGALNTSGLRDEALMQAAVNLRRTPDGDENTYYARWMDFQREWVRALPMVPLYTNTYFDAFSLRVGGYDPADYSSWADAIFYVSLGEGS